MAAEYDAIVVGARCAGSPTAMLLARAGHRVLLVDRATFPSDTLSTLIIQPPGVAALERWGLLGRVVASGCPPLRSWLLDFGEVVLGGTPRPVEGVSTAYAPRRGILDKILVDAAAHAGAEVREHFNVDELLVSGGRVVGIRGHGADGHPVVERARVVIGADGRTSHVAKWVGAEQYNEKPRLQYGYYTFFRDLPVDGVQFIIRPGRAMGAIPTNDDLTLVVFGWPVAEMRALKSDPEAGFWQTAQLAPAFAERVRAAARVEPFLGGGVWNYFRKPYGPGWALVGDAGYNKDPVVPKGISDAFASAELCADALDEYLRGLRTYDVAMAGYQRVRDERGLPIYEFATQLATMEPPPPEMRQLFGALAGDEEAMADFVSVTAGTISPAEFFAPDNIARIMAPTPRTAAVG
ncbi:oxidoreductase [Prauserella sp. PE36]|uniref:NAD(P)/FAD-dependent oxidoreductase n=1 Tax=Prauserella sp. PE36 TaxID=1504709 RepID=UPI000DE4BCCA|nr:NAD(P)/FAD-dependent oxidoreductase [Prauserella sp. PE36]RBM17271.1 oxidoreductase [Prauserella sp. PE36]